MVGTARRVPKFMNIPWARFKEARASGPLACHQGQLQVMTGSPWRPNMQFTR
jgi:hypothetical protein